ncbi:cupredoxin domain-containing protein [Sphingomonas sp.]|jgi:plastocyanin|uniref:cupredoxin domain-containing protein n=1 Tax=Sphingomonas sp. TaxID=28214 RepID=UPI002E3323A9|nr:cupredoxin domain-containing protein [Sphingomonas sp.]HEX4695429.1 cupredoxin domain-containing protein [Sphingomonas sp.]
MAAGIRGMAIGIAVGALSIAVAANSQAAPHQFTVTMSNMNYGALPSTAKVGDTIVWVNRDTVPHTVTARDHSFDLRVAPGQSGRMTLQKAGIIPIYCVFHMMMRGTLKVAAK